MPLKGKAQAGKPTLNYKKQKGIDRGQRKVKKAKARNP